MAGVAATAMSNTVPHFTPEHPPRPHSLGELFWAFTWLALQGFGGVLAVVQRELVDRRRWMTNEEFIEDWAAAQILPGPNVVNLSIMVGDRYFGLRVEAELSASRDQTAGLLADAERRAQAIVEEAKARASHEAEKIMAAAQADAQQQVIKAREALREQVAGLAIKGAEQILRKEVNAAAHADLLSRLKTEL